jgi:hypothetical protein
MCGTSIIKFAFEAFKNFFQQQNITTICSTYFCQKCQKNLSPISTLTLCYDASQIGGMGSIAG